MECLACGTFRVAPPWESCAAKPVVAYNCSFLVLHEAFASSFEGSLQSPRCFHCQHHHFHGSVLLSPMPIPNSSSCKLCLPMSVLSLCLLDLATQQVSSAPDLWVFHLWNFPRLLLYSSCFVLISNHSYQLPSPSTLRMPLQVT